MVISYQSSTSNGTEYRIDCAPGQVLAGIGGIASGNRVNQLRPVFAGVDSNGNWTGSPQAGTESAGIGSGNPYSLGFAAGTAVTGVAGGVASAYMAVQIMSHYEFDQNSKNIDWKYSKTSVKQLQKLIEHFGVTVDNAVRSGDKLDHCKAGYLFGKNGC